MGLPVVFLWALATITGLYLFYRWLLPKPLPGIPYNDAATKTLLGDAPEALAHVSRTNQLWEWVLALHEKHQSPIFQLFMIPFARPWVIVSDPTEAHDVLVRRKEFDRSEVVGDLFGRIAPDFHIRHKSSDPKFKSNRQLLKDLMTPGFLHEVSAPSIYANVETTVSLWKIKKQEAKGRPFDIKEDIFNAALDTIFAVAFGLDPEDGVTTANIRKVESDKVTSPDVDASNRLTPIHFPEAVRPPGLDAVVALTESIEVIQKSLFPAISYWIYMQTPAMRKAWAVKEKTIKDEVDRSIQRLKSGSKVRRSALDDILHREMALAEKEGRTPKFHSRTIYDELFGFLLAGHDTTSNTLLWALKFFSDTPAAQTRLRAELRSGYLAAVSENRAPTVDEITKTSIPYLDATIEEVARLSRTASGAMRTAMVDTTLLGYHIPKGTHVAFMNGGPGYLSPAFPIPESQRSPSSLALKDKFNEWPADSRDLGEFRPERWLVINEKGEEEFNSQAGPQLNFGGGPRGCFGRRLAYLELRIILVMIVFHFKLLQVPESVGGWNVVDKLMRNMENAYIILGDVD